MKKIYLNRIYVLDTGTVLLMLLTKEFTDTGVVCELKQRYDGVMAEINYELFKQNGYEKI